MGFLRTRTKSTQAPTSISWDGMSELPNSLPFSGNTANVSWQGENASMEDVNSPNYRRDAGLGNLTMNPMTLVKTARTMTPGTFSEGPYNGYSVTVTGDFIASVEFSVPRPAFDISSDAGSMANVALVKAYAKMNKSAVLSGESLGQLSQTVRMLKRPFNSAQTLIALMLKYRARRLGKTAASCAAATANSWLEYRYGWKPLIMDAMSIIQNANNLSGRCGQHLVARTQENQVRSANSEFSRVQLSPPSAMAGFLASGSIIHKQSVRCCAGVYYTVENTTTPEQLSRIFGLRANDTIQVAWELVPYSFVVDWFTNVGDWLQAITPAPGISVRGSWVTTVDETTTSYNGRELIKLPWWYGNLAEVSGSCGSSVLTNTTVTRVPNPSLPTHPEFLSRPLSVTHAADAVALLMKPIVGSLKALKH